MKIPMTPSGIEPATFLFVAQHLNHNATAVTLFPSSSHSKRRGKANPGQILSVPVGLGSQISRQSAHEGGKVVSLTHRPPLLPSKYSWYTFPLGDRGSTVVKVLCYKSEGRWFDHSSCHCIFH